MRRDLQRRMKAVEERGPSPAAVRRAMKAIEEGREPPRGRAGALALEIAQAIEAMDETVPAFPKSPEEARECSAS